MSVTASCGHELTEEEGLGTSIWVKGMDRQGKCIYYTTLCNKCLEQHRKEGLELKTQKERNDYLIKQ